MFWREFRISFSLLTAHVINLMRSLYEIKYITKLRMTKTKGRVSLAHTIDQALSHQ